MKPLALCLSFALLMPLSGCDLFDDDEDVGGLIASQFVTVTVDPSDLSGGLLVSDAAVNSDTFLASLKERMGEIESVNVTRISIEPSPSGVEGVTAWSDLYQGELLVLLLPAGGGPAQQIGRVTVPESGFAALSPLVTTTRQALDAVPDIAAGRFSVRLSAGSTRTAADTFSAPIRVEIELVAF